MMKEIVFSHFAICKGKMQGAWDLRWCSLVTCSPLIYASLGHSNAGHSVKTCVCVSCKLLMVTAFVIICIYLYFLSQYQILRMFSDFVYFFYLKSVLCNALKHNT